MVYPFNCIRGKASHISVWLYMDCGIFYNGRVTGVDENCIDFSSVRVFFSDIFIWSKIVPVSKVANIIGAHI